MKIKLYSKSNQRVRSIINWKKTYHPIVDPEVVFKLRNKGELIGSCYIVKDFIYSLVVNPKYRKNGYGRKLLSAAEKTIKKNGFKKAKLIPQDNEPKLRKYYSSCGYFGFNGNEIGYEEEDKTWWVMEKEL